jgi:hypothetical protein
MSFLHFPRGRQKRTSSRPTFFDSAPNESAVEAYYSEFLGLQKDRTAKQVLPDALVKFLFRRFQSLFWSFLAKQNSKMPDFQSLG